MFQRKMFSMKYLNMVKTTSKMKLNVLCDNWCSNLGSFWVKGKNSGGKPVPCVYYSVTEGNFRVDFVLVCKAKQPGWDVGLPQFVQWEEQKLEFLVSDSKERIEGKSGTGSSAFIFTENLPHARDSGCHFIHEEIVAQRGNLIYVKVSWLERYEPGFKYQKPMLLGMTLHCVEWRFFPHSMTRNSLLIGQVV